MHLSKPIEKPWLDPAGYWAQMTAATAMLDAPYGAVSLVALAHNAHDMLRRANGVKIASRKQS